MARRQMAALAVAIGLTAVAGSTALARSMQLGASTTTRDVLAAAMPAGTADDLAARAKQLDAIDNDLNIAARRPTPSLPKVPHYDDGSTPAAAEGRQVAVAFVAPRATATSTARPVHGSGAAPVARSSATPVTHTSSSATHGGTSGDDHGSGISSNDLSVASDQGAQRGGSDD